VTKVGGMLMYSVKQLEQFIALRTESEHGENR